MKKTAPFIILIAGVFWGMIGIFVKRLTAMGFGPMEIVTIRAVTTVVLVFIFLLIYDRSLLKIRLKHVWCFIGTGIVSIVFFNFCYFSAINMTSLSVAAILLYTAPVFVMLMSAFLFREKITAVKLVALVATFAGCVLVTGIVGVGESISTAGIIVGLGAGIGYALYSIFSRYALMRGYHPFTIAFYTFLFAIIGTLPLIDYKVLATAVTSGIPTIGFCFLFGICSAVIPYIIYTIGLKELDNGKAAVIASIEPVTATVLSVVVYKEQLTVLQIIGIVLVLAAIAICSFEPKTKEKPKGN